MGEFTEADESTQPPPPQPISCARGPNEEKEMWSKQCFVRRYIIRKCSLNSDDKTDFNMIIKRNDFS